MDDLNQQEQRLAALEAKCRDEKCAQLTIERLDGLLARWQESGHLPEAVGALSSGECSALVLAAGQESRLDSPLRTFLMLDGWLQRWVLETRGLSSFVATGIATYATI